MYGGWSFVCLRRAGFLVTVHRRFADHGFALISKGEVYFITIARTYGVGSNTSATGGLSLIALDGRLAKPRVIITVANAATHFLLLTSAIIAA
jgi:hypothetical protein